MAKATASYPCSDCGATVTRRVDGYNRTDADRRAAWIEKQGGQCEACYVKARDAQRAAEAEAAHAQAAAAGLPALEGSPKQVAWAERIRAAVLADEAAQVATYTSRAPSPEAAAARFGITLAEAAARIAAVHDAIIAARRELEMQIAAAWWIDNRDVATTVLKKAAAAAISREFPRHG